MKKLSFLVVMVVVLVGLLAGQAFAVRYDSGYQAFTTSPHGQYSTATTKCAACHAVHNPGNLSGMAGSAKDSDAERDAAIGESEALLRGTIADACTYCHITGGFAIKTVYNEVEANYTTASGFGHTSTGGAMSDTGVNCVDCHQVHGAANAMASTTDAYMYQKILKDQPAYDTDAPALVANAGPGPVQANITSWCTGCHNYYEAGYNDNSHVMTSDIDAYGNASATMVGAKVAWASSADCRSCHQDGVTNQAAAVNGVNNYPHFTAGYRFLRQADYAGDAAEAPASAPAAGSATNDGTCLICHANDDIALGMQGIGQEF